MKLFRKGKRIEAPVTAAAQGTASGLFPAVNSYTPLVLCQNTLYKSLMEAVPIINAAVHKIIRLTGGFSVETGSDACDKALAEFLSDIPCDSGERSIYSFLDTYFEQLLIYGTAVGEMLTDEYGNIRYLYNARPDDVSLLRDPNDFSKILVCRADAVPTPVKHQERILFTALDAEPGSLYGTSVLYGLPFVSSVLLKIFEATKSNWDRVGNVRFAVTYKPDGEALSKSFAKERAELIASEWSEAMKSGSVKDFVAVGDVDIKVIGADNQIPDSEIPVREMLEQIVAKLGIPPFLLGLSWSTTETMSKVETDVLTTELWHYRRHLTPVIERICSTFLRNLGSSLKPNVVWDDITLQDEVENARARLYSAQAKALEKEEKTD